MILSEDLISSGLIKEVFTSQDFPQGAVVEVGSGAGSTRLLADSAHKLSRPFRTIDVSASAVSQARNFLLDRPNMEAVRTTGANFLARFSAPVAFAYLDGYEWVDSASAGPDYPPGLSKRESELVHLQEAILLEPRVPRNGWVLFDDTWLLEKRPPAQSTLASKVDFRTLTNRSVLEDYDVFGKGSVAVPFLLTCGFTIVAVSERPQKTQVLLNRVDLRDSPSPGPYSYEYFTQLLAEHRKTTYATRGIRFLVRRRIPSVRRMRRALVVGVYRRLPRSIQPLALKIRRSARGTQDR